MARLANHGPYLPLAPVGRPVAAHSSELRQQANLSIDVLSFVVTGKCLAIPKVPHNHKPALHITMASRLARSALGE